MRTIPYNSYLKATYFDLETQEQVFEILYRGIEFSDPTVVTLVVKANDTIEITGDRRLFFRGVIRDERKKVTQKGFGNERRFLRVVNARTARTPKWFIGVFRATRQMDHDGFDAFAHIRVPGVTETVRVPIQIKSSMLGVQYYTEKRPGHIKAGVLVFIVSEEVTDAKIRNQLMDNLRAIRATRTNPYKEFLESIAAR